MFYTLKCLAARLHARILLHWIITCITQLGKDKASWMKAPSSIFPYTDMLEFFGENMQRLMQSQWVFFGHFPQILLTSMFFCLRPILNIQQIQPQCCIFACPVSEIGSRTVMFETMCMATVFMWNHLLSFKMVLGRRVEHSVQQVKNAEWLNLVICLLYHSYINSVVWTPKKARTTQNQEQGSTWRYNGDKDDTELLWCVCINKRCLLICLTVILNC